MQKRTLCFALIIIVLSLSSSCTTGAPSDDEAIRLVKRFYLYYFEGKKVDAKIIRRGTYIKEYKCYPIEFLISAHKQESSKKTFYFFKNKYGKADIRKFKIKQST